MMTIRIRNTVYLVDIAMNAAYYEKNGSAVTENVDFIINVAKRIQRLRNAWNAKKLI